MVAKPAEPQNGKITALEKENAEMKEELEYINQSQKARDVLWALITAAFAYLCSTLLYDMAQIGANAVAVESNMSETGAALLIFVIATSYILVVLYIVYVTAITLIYTLQDDLKRGAERLSIFIKGGAKALKETPPEPEEANAEPESQTSREKAISQKTKSEKSDPVQETFPKTNS